MNPSIRGEDDVAYCITKGTHWDEASHFCGSVKALAKEPLANHGGTLLRSSDLLSVALTMQASIK